MDKPKAKLGKRYTINCGGNSFQRVLVTLSDGCISELDIRVREGWHGPQLLTSAEAKAEALRRVMVNG